MSNSQTIQIGADMSKGDDRTMITVVVKDRAIVMTEEEAYELLSSLENTLIHIKSVKNIL